MSCFFKNPPTLITRWPDTPLALTGTALRMRTIVTQYAMNPVGDLGLLKMDFLGLKTLTVIRNACAMVKQYKRVDVPIDNLPLDDQKTYDILNKGMIPPADGT